MIGSGRSGRIGRGGLLIILSIAMSACGEAPETDVDYLQRAKSSYSQGDVRASLIDIKNAIKSNPSNIEARRFLGELYLFIGDGAGAEKELRHIKESGGVDATLMVSLLNALMLQGRYQEMLNLIDDQEVQLDEVGKLEKVIAYKAEALLGVARYEEALAELSHGLARYPLSPLLLTAKAKLNYSRGEIAEAEKLLDSVIGGNSTNNDAKMLRARIFQMKRGYLKAEELLNEVVLSEPKKINTPVSIAAKLDLVSVLVYQERLKEAEEHIEFLLKAAPGHYMPYYLMARQKFQQGNVESAKDYLAKALVIYPGHGPSLLLMGAIDSSMNILEQAERNVNKFLAMQPGHAEAKKLLATIYLKQDRPEKAKEILKSLLTETGDDFRVLALLGGVEVREGDSSAGVEYLKEAIRVEPDNNELWVKLAGAYLVGGESDKAIKILDEVLGEGEYGSEADVILVIAHLEKDEVEEALRVVGEAIVKSPNDLLLNHLAGVIYLNKGDLTQAGLYFEKSLSVSPDFFPALTGLAQISHKKGDVDGARELYEKALAKDEKNVVLMAAVARLSAELGETERAILLLQKASASSASAVQPRLFLAYLYRQNDHFDKAVRVLEEILSITPNHHDALLMLGDTVSSMGDHKKAKKLVSKAVKHSPRSAVAHFQMARQHLRSGLNKTAITSLKKVLSIRPDMPMALELMVQLYLQDGKIIEAMGAVERSRELLPDSVVSYGLEGDILLSQKQYAKAAEVFLAAAERFDLSLLLIKGFDALQRAGEIEAAYELLEKRLSKQDDNQVRTALAVTYHNNKKNDDAKRHYLQIVESDANNYAILNNLAWLYYEENSPKAIKFAERAYRAQPNNGAIADTLGWLLAENGDLERGVELLTRANTLTPGNSEIVQHLAIALDRQGLRADAQQLLLQLIKQSPKAELMDESRAILPAKL